MPSLIIKIMLGDIKSLGEIEIGNITRDPSRISSDYLWRIKAVDSHDNPIVKEGFIVDSYNGSAIELLTEVLNEWKSDRPLPIDNHGYIGLPEGIKYSAKECWNRIDQVREKQKK